MDKITFTYKLLNIKYKSKTLKDFISLVKEEQCNRCICQVYYGHDQICRPYFDFDYNHGKKYNKAQRDQYINEIIEMLKTEISSDLTLYIAEAHRYIDDKKGFKYSFHIYIDKYRTTVKELYKLAKHKNNKSFDVSVYKSGANIIRFANQKKISYLKVKVVDKDSCTGFIKKTNVVEGIKPTLKKIVIDKEGNKKITRTKDLSKYILAYVKDDFKEYKNNYSYDLDAISSNKKSTKIIRRSKLFNNVVLKTDEDTIKMMNELSSIVDPKLADNFKTWMPIMMIFKNYRNREAGHIFSKLSSTYDKIAVDNFIDSNNKCISNLVTIGTLKMHAKKYNPEKYKDIISKYNKTVTKDNIESYIITDKYTNDYMEINNPTIFNNPFEPKKDKVFQRMKDEKTILIQSATGTGKTFSINKLIENIKQINEKKILCVTSRISMAVQLKKSLNNFTLYKTDDYSDKHIISLEQLYKLTRDNDYKPNVIILDEFCSLLDHFGSPTLIERCKILEGFDRIVKDADIVISCDATITQAELYYLKSIRKEFFYLRNNYENKKGINMTIYGNSDHNSNVCVELFMNSHLKDDIKNKRSMLLFSDSKTIAEMSILQDKIFNIFREEHYERVKKDISAIVTKRTGLIENITKKYNAEDIENEIKQQFKEYILLYTSDHGSINNDIENINELWKNKLVVCSPTVTYALDVQIPNQYVYAIYEDVSIDAFKMLQQLGRSRICKRVKVLFNKKNYFKHKNDLSLTLDESREILYEQQYNSIISTLKGNKYIYSLKTAKAGAKAIMNEKMKDIHFELQVLKSHIHNLFDLNKAEILKVLCEKQGFNVKIEMLKIKSENQQLLSKKVIKALNKEIIINHRKYYLTKIDQYLNNSKIAYDCNIHKDYFERLYYNLKISEKKIKEDYTLMHMVCDDDLLTECFKGLTLYYPNNMLDKKIEKMEKKERKPYKNEYINLLKLMRFTENKLKIKRFKLDEITNKRAKEYINELEKNPNILYVMYSTQNPKKMKERTNKLIKSLKNTKENFELFHVAKLLSDIYQKICSLVIIHKTRPIINGIKITSYSILFENKYVHKLKELFPIKNNKATDEYLFR